MRGTLRAPSMMHALGFMPFLREASGMSLDHIIVATDFSPESEAALRHGVHIARSSGATLQVVHVVETPTVEEGLESSQPAIEHWRGDSVAQLERELEPYAEEKIRIEREVVEAPSTAEGLQKVIDARSADLTIVGCTGRSGVKEMLLGSTACKVVRTVETNVFVARGDTPHEKGYERILIPTDFSESADEALELALALAARNAQFDIVHFWRVPEATRIDEYATMVIQAVGKSVEERGRKLLDSFKKSAPDSRFLSVQASPERGIDDKLDEGSYDLVVVGSYGRSKLRRWLLGSVAEHTARTAPCSVAIARPDRG